MMKIVLATRNPGKVSEMRALLDGLPLELVPAGELQGAPHVEETEPTLEGNARRKAEALARFTGMAALADDTGLEVDALEGRPGVHSARYAGPDCDETDNRRLLLQELEKSDNRRARFRAVIAFIDDRGVHTFEGICPGTILREERGTGGFGYDALFVPEGEELTFAEMTDEAKNAISHRGRALRELASYLRARFGE